MAYAGESRSALTVTAYVAVTGSINAKASVAETPRKSSKSSSTADAQFGACASVALLCAGPKSTRVTLHTEGETLIAADDDASNDIDGTDLCASPVSASRGIAMCSSASSDLSLLGITVDY